MKLFERVKKIASSLASSQTAMGRELGLTQSKFNGYFTEKSEGNLWKHLPRILELYPQVRRDWLYFDEGEMLGSQDDKGQAPPANADYTRRIAELEERVAELKYVVELQKQMLATRSDIFLKEGVAPGSASAAPSAPLIID